MKRETLKVILLVTTLIQMILGIIVSVYSLMNGGHLFGISAILVTLIVAYIFYSVARNEVSDDFDFTMIDAIGFPILSMVFIYQMFQHINGGSRFALSLMLAFSLIGCGQALLKFLYLRKNKSVDHANIDKNEIKE